MDIDHVFARARHGDIERRDSGCPPVDPYGQLLVAGGLSHDALVASAGSPVKMPRMLRARRRAAQPDLHPCLGAVGISHHRSGPGNLGCGRSGRRGEGGAPPGSHESDRFRIGASSLLNDVLMQIRKEKTGVYQSPDYFTVD